MKNLSATLLITLLLPLFATSRSVSAQPAPNAIQNSTYKVPAVYLPELKRPRLTLDLKGLDGFGLGRLPSFDGETFHVNLRGPQPVRDFDSARKLIGELFSRIGLQADLGSLEPAEKPVVNGGLREDKRLEEFQKPYEKNFRDKLNRKVGKLSKGTIQTMREEGNALAEQARRKTTVFPFHQTFNRVPVENSQVAYASRDNGINTINGNVFTQINLTNAQRLLEADVIEAATKHISTYARVKGEPQKIKPTLVIVPYAEGFKFAWKLIVEAEDGPYTVWIDAEDGRVLQLLPAFWSDSAKGMAFTPDPNGGTMEISFEVDAPTGGNYSLTLTGQLNVTNNGADSVTSTNLTIPDAGSGTADFNVSPLNDTAVERTSTAGYNSRFQEINTFAWIYRIRWLALLFGGQPLPAFTAQVNLGGDQNAFSDGRFYVGDATTGSSTACNKIFNAAIDATVLAHEYGHNINGLQYGVGGGSMTGSINEGLADFWSCTIHNTDTFGSWWGHNCPAPVQSGYIPRQAEPLDVFPEHRAGNAEIHADGQMICWALWSMRREFLEQGDLGALVTNVNVMTAMTTAGLGLLGGFTDKSVHDSYVDLERQLVVTNGTSWNTAKILSAFARAGLFLSDKEAVIDIDDDYINRASATPPTFTVWTGRDYNFSGSTADTTGTLPFNTHYTVEVANDASFTTNYFSSGSQTGVTAGAGGTATWQLTGAMWDALKTGEKLYYRVTTEDDAKGNTRDSSSTGDGTITGLAVPFAVINNSGECECKCSSSKTIAAVPGETHGAAAPLLFAIPFLYGAYRMTRSRKNGARK